MSPRSKRRITVIEEEDLEGLYEGGAFVDQILELDSFDYVDDDDVESLVVAEWAKEWPGYRHIKDMGEDWFEVAGMRRVTEPINRFRNSDQARKWFTSNYTVICYCHSARFWCCVVRDKVETKEGVTK